MTSRRARPASASRASRVSSLATARGLAVATNRPTLRRRTSRPTMSRAALDRPAGTPIGDGRREARCMALTSTPGPGRGPIGEDGTPSTGALGRRHGQWQEVALEDHPLLERRLQLPLDLLDLRAAGQARHL